MEKQKLEKTYLFVLICLVCLVLISCQISSTNPSYEGTLEALQETDQEIATKIARQDEIISYLATRVGAAHTPAAQVYPTFTPYVPLSGSVELEGGACCAGGTAGETLTIKAAFEASSPYGEVQEMRSQAAGYALNESDMRQTAWESFSSEKEFETQLAINWTGFYVCVQFQDEIGNRSQVYCDDISLEGQPPSPTP